jgi:hypothetical protein
MDGVSMMESKSEDVRRNRFCGRPVIFQIAFAKNRIMKESKKPFGSLKKILILSSLLCSGFDVLADTFSFRSSFCFCSS